ncbi:uncharacterized protein BDR25DRAFT_47414 [Lindgomyces ingoldianus]|uniref:Uncharacterized protein n=1 Tax=Lindgomyces ingoldianus TaxID=673940 RepID=A0ACB6QT09_9PLEO|nr:uncharacterized protein BDR25DRAFT_47414 [Lindgomyces ingoldianus]KAF2469222.1 hypothetical protein BDR25DRAFT_47414 [Lindgomyces ingoldianus]
MNHCFSFIMLDRDQDADIEDGLRLEDVSRRSACDRCRTMKTRCERSHHRGIAQLQQCRRCREAQVRCITTLEAQQSRNEDMDKPIQRNRKRPRGPSIEANQKYSVTKTLESLDERHHATPLEHRPERITSEKPSSSPIAGSQGGLLSSLEIDRQWHELSKMVDLGGSTIHNLADDQTRATAMPPTINVTIPYANQNADSGTFIEAMTTMSSGTVQSMPEATSFDHMPQETRSLFWNSLLPLSSSDQSDAPTPQVEANCTIMSRLMEFNTKVSHNLREFREGNRPWSDDNSMLVKTLQHSDAFLELLASFTCPGVVLDGSSLYIGSAGSRHEGSTLGRSDKVDTDVALQLLSCHMNVSSMYEILCVELTRPHLRLEEAEALSALRLEGLRNLDVDMRGQVLLHICSLTFVKIQKELELIRQRGMLTQTADTIFGVVLGGGNVNVLSPPFGMGQIVDSFRRLVMARGSS